MIYSLSEKKKREFIVCKYLMHTKKTYSIRQMIWWTRFETLFFIILITVLVSAYYFLDLNWIKIPWTPLALIGTAVAFVIGFQNNAAYVRIWEARKIWGRIVNTSRTLGTYTQDIVSNEHTETPFSNEQLKHEIKIIIYRHIAWMTALRHSMRTSKP
ncbi:MAG: putative membrane protein [Ulvibacter sp.]|jgi:putative membrane protein